MLARLRRAFRRAEK